MEHGEKKEKALHSLRQGIFLHMVLAVFLPLAVFMLILLRSGVFSSIRDLPVSLMQNQLERTNFDLSTSLNNLLKKTEYLRSNLDSAMLGEEEKLNILVDTLNQDLLCSEVFYFQETDGTGIVLEDTEPDNYNASNTDILIVSGQMGNSRKISLSKKWTIENQNEELVHLETLIKDEKIEQNFWIFYHSNLYYLCPSWENGSLHCITGTRISSEELNQLLPKDENYNFLLVQGKTILFEFENEKPVESDYREYKEKLTIYGTFYGDEGWTINLRCAKSYVTQWVNWLRLIVCLAFLAAGVLFLIITLLLIQKISNPLIEISQKIQHTNGNLSTKKTTFREFRDICDEVNRMYLRITQNNRRFRMALHAVSDRMGTYEVKKDSDYVEVSEGTIILLGIPQEEMNGLMVSKSYWENCMESRRMTGQYWLYVNAKGIKRYLEFNENREKEGTFGLILDKTEEMTKIHHLQYMSTHDSLTGLYNVSHFKSVVQPILEENRDKINAVVFCDLDNLKYINDTYGHASGDQYIKRMADEIRILEQSERCIGARVSGDEFVFMLYGFEDKNVVWNLVWRTFAETRGIKFSLPTGQKCMLKASLGIAWAPEDSNDISQLIKYADFAMYIVKHSTKGEVGEFNKSVYSEKFYLLQKQEEFNRILDNNLIGYQYQPIVDIRKQTIFGYEALMRPMSKEFASPLTFLDMAKSQSKLYRIEQLTFYNNLITYKKRQDQLFKEKYLFINSIPNQKIDPMMLAGEHLEHLVVEMTENEQVKDENGQSKLAMLRAAHIQIAIDDYGSGYNNEVTVVTTEPRYVKIDRDLITNIENSADKKELVDNIVNTAKKRGILICAEGVETKGELRMVMELGVDLIQGYYFSKPLDHFEDFTDEDVKKKMLE